MRIRILELNLHHTADTPNVSPHFALYAVIAALLENGIVLPLLKPRLLAVIDHYHCANVACFGPGSDNSSSDPQWSQISTMACESVHNGQTKHFCRLDKYIKPSHVSFLLVYA
jgi:hypothetical protein